MNSTFAGVSKTGNELSQAVAGYNLIRNDRVKLQEVVKGLYPRLSDQQVFAPIFSVSSFKGFPEIRESKNGLSFQVGKRTVNITNINLTDASFKLDGVLLKWNANVPASDFARDFLNIFEKKGKRASWNFLMETAYAEPITLVVLGSLALATTVVCVGTAFENRGIHKRFETFKKSVEDLTKICKLKNPCIGVTLTSFNSVVISEQLKTLPAGKTYVNDRLFVNEDEYRLQLARDLGRGTAFIPGNDAKKFSEFYKQLKGTRICVEYCAFKDELDAYNKACQISAGDERADSPRMSKMRRSLDEKLSHLLWPGENRKVEVSLNEADFLGRMIKVAGKNEFFSLNQAQISGLYRDYKEAMTCHQNASAVNDDTRGNPVEKFTYPASEIETAPSLLKVKSQ
jgi:hypothetical protein